MSSKYSGPHSTVASFVNKWAKMDQDNHANNDRERLLTYSNPSNKILGGETEVKVYRKRWYILAMFFCLSVGQGIMFNTWAPIQSTARAVYQWDSFMIDLMPALGCIAPCFTIIPLGWLMDVKGKVVRAKLNKDES